ncbi:hypothetical protein ABO04_08985 [Nitrosomonas sp. HPC101]|uniref:EcsC family protein n=1 Tax=Nitrosomonas sp. HPC101 TaxID=1658667 RepID=UPI001370E4AF|nr:EcsC family protein [Nitrosomonas sp. HPC101]MXS86033.1 hypothetical protein [Nitrosomonas sp. HPC101]
MSKVIEVNDKPILLKAVELVLAEPASIRKEALQLKEKYVTRYGSDRSEDEINTYAADKIISNYSYYTAFVGGTTALTGAIPGLGTVLATFGGATANAALSMKYQIEMTMAIATIYGRDITIEEEKRLCLMIAGLGAISEMTKVGGKESSKKASVKMMQQYLNEAPFQTLQEIFRKAGIAFTKKAARKAIPFGVGVVIGFSANKGLTWYVGTKARDFFSVTDSVV